MMAALENGTSISGAKNFGLETFKTVSQYSLPEASYDALTKLGFAEEPTHAFHGTPLHIVCTPAKQFLVIVMEPWWSQRFSEEMTKKIRKIRMKFSQGSKLRISRSNIDKVGHWDDMVSTCRHEC